MITQAQLAQILQIADPEERASRYAQGTPEVIKLSVAENVLIYDAMREHVFSKVGVVGVDDTKYKTSYGDEDFRRETAALLGKTYGVTIAPGNVFGVAGVGGALECLAFTLLPPGSEVLVPAPCWQGFAWCFGQRPGCRVVTFAPASPQLTWRDVALALQRNPNARALVLTNPHNPLGINYDPKNLEEIYANVLQKHPEVHIISDEIYCHSQTRGAAPAFVGALALRAYVDAPAQQKARVHVVWGFAKDFGLSGFRAGVIVSTSERVKIALAGAASRQAMAWFSPMDSLKLFMIVKLLTFKNAGGRPVREVALEDYREKLTAARILVASALDKRRIAYLPGSHAAQFFWLDLRKDLGAHPHTCATPLYPEIDAKERALECYLREVGKVQLLPGGVLSSPEPGWFRLCYTAEKPEVVLEAVTRIADALKRPRGEAA
jgi:aspartate/methionine/tyrosine aminotransferase